MPSLENILFSFLAVYQPFGYLNIVSDSLNTILCFCMFCYLNVQSMYRYVVQVSIFMRYCGKEVSKFTDEAAYTVAGLCGKLLIRKKVDQCLNNYFTNDCFRNHKKRQKLTSNNTFDSKLMMQKHALHDEIHQKVWGTIIKGSFNYSAHQRLRMYNTSIVHL